MLPRARRCYRTKHPSARNVASRTGECHVAPEVAPHVALHVTPESESGTTICAARTCDLRTRRAPPRLCDRARLPRHYCPGRVTTTRSGPRARDRGRLGRSGSDLPPATRPPEAPAWRPRHHPRAIGDDLPPRGRRLRGHARSLLERQHAPGLAPRHPRTAGVRRSLAHGRPRPRHVDRLPRHDHAR